MGKLKRNLDEPDNSLIYKDGDAYFLEEIFNQMYPEDSNESKTYYNKDRSNEEVLSYMKEHHPDVITEFDRRQSQPQHTKAWVQSYHESEGYKDRINNSDLPQEVKDYMVNFSPDSPVTLDHNLAVSESVHSVGPRKRDKGILLGTIDKGALKYMPLRAVFANSGEGTINGTLAHELDHDNPLYNSPISKKNKNYNASPEYGNDYTLVPEYWRTLLNSEYNESYNPEKSKYDQHDWELSENHADLMDMRQGLYENGIFDSRKSKKEEGGIFTQEMLDKYRQTERGKNDRYLKYHSDEDIIKAINDVAKTKSKHKNGLIKQQRKSLIRNDYEV